MVGLAENIQACLRIFRRAQHQWLARDILHRAQGVFYCFCLMAQIEVQEVQGVQKVQKVQIRPIRLIRLIRGREEGPILWRTALQAAFAVCYLYRGRCPRLLRVVPSRHRSAGEYW